MKLHKNNCFLFLFKGFLSKSNTPTPCQSILNTSVADPDPACPFDAGPDPAGHFDADRDPSFKNNMLT
jgi:hypothetical protein